MGCPSQQLFFLNQSCKLTVNSRTSLVAPHRKLLPGKIHKCRFFMLVTEPLPFHRMTAAEICMMFSPKGVFSTDSSGWKNTDYKWIISNLEFISHERDSKHISHVNICEGYLSQNIFVQTTKILNFSMNISSWRCLTSYGTQTGKSTEKHCKTRLKNNL